MRGGPLTTRIRSGKQIIFPTESHGAQGSFRGVVVDLQAPVVAVTHQRFPSSQRITNRRRRIRLSGELSQGYFEPFVSATPATAGRVCRRTRVARPGVVPGSPFRSHTAPRFVPELRPATGDVWATCKS